MNKLIKMVTIVAGFGAMLSFAGCCAKTPDKVAVEFSENFWNGKIDVATKLCTPSTAALMGMASGMIEEDKDSQKWIGAKFEAVETKVDGDKAIVVLKRTAKTGETEVMKGKDACTLVKQDGEWKVDIKKEN